MPFSSKTGRIFSVRACLAGLLLTGILLVPVLGARVATAQNAEEQVDPNVPFLVINVASVERILGHAVTAFDAAGRPEVTEVLGGVLEKANDLQGLNRNQAMGVMFFLNGLTPEPVAYVPVKNVEELLKTVEVGPLTTKKVGDDRYEIVANRQTLHARLIGDYAFIANSASAIDREFRDPSRVAGRLSALYDVAVSVNLKSIAPTTRDLFLSIVRANSESDLQRRDNESAGAHRMRKAAGLRNIEMIEQLVTQGEELTLGWTVSPTTKTATLELVVIASPSSEYAAHFNEMRGARSRFAGLLEASTPLTASLAWKLDKSAKKMFQELISGVEIELSKGLKIDDASAEGDARSGNPITELARILKRTTESGKLDAVFQFVGQPPGPFVLLGGAEVADGAALSSVLKDIATRLKESEAFSSVRLNDFSHKGVSFSRLELARIPERERRIYGEKPSLFLGASDEIFWFALGGDDAIEQLKTAIDTVARPVPETVTAIPFQFVMNFSRWMEIFSPDPKPDGFAARAHSTFSKGGDALRLEALPVDDGIRLRLHFDEAFIRLIGQEVARRIEERENEKAQEAERE